MRSAMIQILKFEQKLKLTLLYLFSFRSLLSIVRARVREKPSILVEIVRCPLLEERVWKWYFWLL